MIKFCRIRFLGRAIYCTPAIETGFVSSREQRDFKHFYRRFIVNLAMGVYAVIVPMGITLYSSTISIQRVVVEAIQYVTILIPFKLVDLCATINVVLIFIFYR